MANVNDLSEAIQSQFRGLNGRHPGQWPIIPQLACAAAVAAAAIFLGWFAEWNSQMDALSQGQQAEEKLKEEYKSKVAQAINLDGLRRQKEQVGEYVATLEKQLPSKAEMDALLSDINQAGVGRGLQFELFKPGQVAVKNYYAELPIDIRVNGDYHDIGSFTSDIANLPRIVTLNNLNLVAGTDGRLHLNAVAKTFRYLDPEEVAEQRSAAKKNSKGAGGGKHSNGGQKK